MTWSAGAATPPSVSLVVPLFNEASRVGATVGELFAFIRGQPPCSELLLVDDGSSDGTADVVEALIGGEPDLQVRVLRCEHKGKGAALRAGIGAAKGDIVAFCDVDLSTPLADLQVVIEAASRSPMLAIGSRDLAGSELVRPEGRVRESLGKTYNRLVQLTLLPGVLDTQCGAKAASRDIWQSVLPYCKEEGFAWDVEVIALARTLGIRVQEIAITWSHDEGTSVRVARDGLAMVVALARIRRTVAATMDERAADGRRGGGVFDAENARALAAVDQTHWWFRGKAGFVAWALRRWAPREGVLVDVGGGAGGVTAMLGWRPANAVVVEGAAELARQAVARHALLGIQGSATELPVAAGAASVVCLLDVIEHLVDPVAALREARDCLTADGVVVITVPAHPRLWSSADEALGHARRYTRRSLGAELEEAGLRPIFTSHVFSWLVVPVWAKRRLRASESPELGLDVISPAVDRAALVLCAVERLLIRICRLPLGTTIICVARPG